MIYRITYKNFLVHAIDYFSLADLTEIQYLVLSAKITCLGKLANVVKMSILYPPAEAVIAYAETEDKEVLRKMYVDYLDGADMPKNVWNPCDAGVYQAFINPLLHHVDVMIVNDTSEDVYIDILEDYIEKRFEIPMINLNELFERGSVGPLYIDRDLIRDKAVDVRQRAAHEETRSLSSSTGGRIKLLGLMRPKDMKKKLKELEIPSDGLSNEEMHDLLMEYWCNGDDVVD